MERGLGSLATPSELACYVTRERERLWARRRSLRGSALTGAHSYLIDAVINRVFELAVEETEHRFGKLKSVLCGVCIAACGGYGRRELSPFSDVDVAFISASDGDARADQLLKGAYRMLMDSFPSTTGLKVGYSYRQVGECRELPLDVQTALLDARHLAGSERLLDRFSRDIRNAIVPGPFVIQHIEQRRLPGHSVHRVEPDLKEGKGGLRDVQTARWIAQAAFGVPGDKVRDALASSGLTKRELARLRRAEEFLTTVRSQLHLVCGRGNDILSVDRREAVAAEMGYQSGAALMRDYYDHAEVVHGVWERTADACLSGPLDFGGGIELRSGRLSVANASRMDSEMIARLLDHSVEYKLGLSAETGKIVRRCAKRWGTGRPSRRTSESLLRVIAGPKAGSALLLAEELGVLGALVPEFGRAMREPAADAAHELTVGAHSLAVVRRLHEFVSGEELDLRDAWAAVDTPGVLYLAALLHDIGKIEEAEDHCRAGERMALHIIERLGVSGDLAREIAFVVRHHTAMSEAARLHDLSDHRVAEDLAQVVGSERVLAILYLLTAADLQSVGQSNFSTIQMRFLRELHHRTMAVLKRRSDCVPDVERHRARLAREMSLANVDTVELSEHLDGMPAGYLLNTPPDVLAEHIQYVRRARAGEIVIAFRDDPPDRLTEVTVCAPDAPGLLTRIAGTLFVLGVEIHAAQVFTRESGDRIAIDVLHVDCEGRTLSGLKKLQLESELSGVLLSHLDLQSLASRFGRSLGRLVSPVSVDVVSRRSDRQSAVHVRGADQPGLLYHLTRAMASLEWNIHGARINTWGDMVQDVFFVTNPLGNPLDRASAVMGLRSALAEHGQ